MEEEPRRHVRKKRGVRRIFGIVRAGLLVFFVTIGLVINAVVSAIHRPFKGKKNMIIFILFIAGLLAAIYFGLQWYQGMDDDAGLSQTVTQTLDYPSESSVDSATYKVAGDMPRLISFASIGAEAVIQPVAADQNAKMASPNNIHVAGWFTSSVKPGEKGLSIMNGHLQGRYGRGAFYDLAKLKPGDTFVIAYGDGRIVNFTIKTVRTVSIRDADAAVKQKDPSLEKQLNLIEVTNATDKGTPASNERVIITSAVL